MSCDLSKKFIKVDHINWEYWKFVTKDKLESPSGPQPADAYDKFSGFKVWRKNQ